MPKPKQRESVLTANIRVRQADIDRLNEAARRLGARQRDAVTFATNLLYRELGLDRELVADIRDALFRAFGDDAVITATLTLPGAVELTVAGKPLDGFEGSAIVMLGESPPQVLSAATMLMAHEATRYHFTLGTIPREEVVDGAAVHVPVSELVDHWLPPRLVTAKNLQSVREDMQFRGALRKARDEDDDE
jgi:hypothetical protein